MPLLSILVTLAVFGVVLWLLSLLPMPSEVYRVILVVSIIVMVIWLLHVFGLMPALNRVHA